MPKFNLYQSLHTTVIGPGGRPLEVQIRTPEMHNRAEWGVAAHFSYKEGHSEDVAWLSRIVDWQQEMTDPGEFMANLKIDLEQDEVFAFTPKGDVVTLPAGSTPIDFAYSIHTEVGHRCIGARVAGRLVPLDSKLIVGRHRRDLHLEGRRRRSEPRLARVRGDPLAHRRRSASGSPGSVARTRSKPVAKRWSRRCGARACRPSG